MFSIKLISMLVIISILLLPSVESMKHDSLKPIISAQIEVRDSEGTLIAYLESQRIVIHNLSELNSVLATEGNLENDPIIDMAGNSFQLIKRTFIHNFEYETVFATSKLSYEKDSEPVLLAYYDHDGYLIHSGDFMKITWTILKPIR